MFTRLARALTILCLLWFSTAAEAFTTTTNYTFKLPQVNNAIDQNLWGDELNGNFTSLDSLLKTATNDVTAALSVDTVIDATYQNKMILVDATAGSVTITLLPSATAGSGFKVGVKKVDSSVNTVTVKGNASELIDAANTLVLTNQYNQVTVINNATQWYEQSQMLPTSSLGTMASQNASSVNITGGTISGVSISGIPVVTSGASGRVVIGAITEQWGTCTTGSSTSYGVAFSGTPYHVSVTLNIPISQWFASANPISSFSFTPIASNGAVEPCTWFAVGPT